jgi:hypothetical protein
MGERIIGTMKMDVHVVEEIEDRPELQDEAQKLLVVSLVIITLFELIAIFSATDVYAVESQMGTIIQTILLRFVGGFVYIGLLAAVGKAIGGQETETSNQEMLRVLAYAYVASAIAEILSTIDDLSDNDALFLIWLIFTFYSYMVFAFVIRRALDKGYGTAIITIVIAIIGLGLYVLLVSEIVTSIFGTPWDFVD